MSKYIRQLRYYKDEDKRNYPINDENEGTISLNQLINPKFFSQYMPIIHLGIQTIPGVKFYLNDNIKTNPIIIGYTGIYELNLENIAEINSLCFDIESIQNIQNIDDAYLIIDMISEEV